MHLGSTEEAGHQPEWARPAAADIPEISSPKQTAAKTTPYKVASGPTESKTQARGAPTTGGAPTAQPVLGKVCVLLSSEKQIALSSESGGDEYTAEAGLSVSSLLSIHRAVRNSGYTLAFVTPSGAPPPMASCGSLEDLGSCLLGEKDVDTSELLQLLQQSQQLRKVAAAGAEDYSCLLLPHHLGAAVDLLKSSSTSVLLRLFVAAQKPVGVVGYGGFCLCSKRPSASEDIRACFFLLGDIGIFKQSNLLPLSAFFVGILLHQYSCRCQGSFSHVLYLI